MTGWLREHGITLAAAFSEALEIFSNPGSSMNQRGFTSSFGLICEIWRVLLSREAGNFRILRVPDSSGTP